MDWNEGNYEAIAEQVAPAARAVVDAAALRERERVVDIGCGTGTASLLAVSRGAVVTGVDPAERLLAIARAKATSASFVLGTATAIPAANASFDVALSAFGVIFAPEPNSAATEIARVLAPKSRFVFSAWSPDGAIAEVGRLRREASTSPVSTSTRAFAWHDAAAIEALLAPHGFAVAHNEHTLEFVSSSPRAFLDDEIANHPGWREASRVLSPASFGALAERALAAFVDANEDAGAFRVTSRYVVFVATR